MSMNMTDRQEKIDQNCLVVAMHLERARKQALAGNLKTFRKSMKIIEEYLMTVETQLETLEKTIKSL